MEIIKLILVSAGILIFVLGGLYLALVVSKEKNPKSTSCTTNDTNGSPSFGCGCGSGACGLPAERKQ